MSRTNWVQLIEEKREALLEAIRKAYKDAYQGCGGDNSGWVYSVILDQDGDIHIGHLSSNSTDGAVWNGTATEVYRVSYWGVDPYWHDYFGKHSLLEGKAGEVLAKYNSLYAEEGEEVQSIRDIDSLPSFLSEHMPELYDYILEEEFDGQMEVFEPEEEIEKSLKWHREEDAMWRGEYR